MQLEYNPLMAAVAVASELKTFSLTSWVVGLGISTNFLHPGVLKK